MPSDDGTSPAGGNSLWSVKSSSVSSALTSVVDVEERVRVVPGEPVLAVEQPGRDVLDLLRPALRRAREVVGGERVGELHEVRAADQPAARRVHE